MSTMIKEITENVTNPLTRHLMSDSDLKVIKYHKSTLVIVDSSVRVKISTILNNLLLKEKEFKI